MMLVVGRMAQPSNAPVASLVKKAGQLDRGHSPFKRLHQQKISAEQHLESSAPVTVSISQTPLQMRASFIKMNAVDTVSHKGFASRRYVGSDGQATVTVVKQESDLPHTSQSLPQQSNSYPCNSVSVYVQASIPVEVSGRYDSPEFTLSPRPSPQHSFFISDYINPSPSSKASKASMTGLRQSAETRTEWSSVQVKVEDSPYEQAPVPSLPAPMAQQSAEVPAQGVYYSTGGEMPTLNGLTGDSEGWTNGDGGAGDVGGSGSGGGGDGGMGQDGSGIGSGGSGNGDDGDNKGRGNGAGGKGKKLALACHFCRRRKLK